MARQSAIENQQEESAQPTKRKLLNHQADAIEFIEEDSVAKSLELRGIDDE